MNGQLWRALKRQIGIGELGQKIDDIRNLLVCAEQRLSEKVDGSRTSGNPRDAPIDAQAHYVHEALFGWSMDELSPVESLLLCETPHQLAQVLLSSDRFREHIRHSIPLWPREKWVCTDFQGLRLWINLRDSHVSYLALTGEYEEPEVAFVLGHLKPGDGFLDIGTNIGIFTLRAAERVGSKGHVYGFEPRPDTFRHVSRSIQENGFSERCTIYNKGLGDVPKPAFIHMDEFVNHGASFVREQAQDAHDVAIELTNLDSIEFDCAIPIVKMDVEGFEPKVILGGQRFFAKHRPVVLHEFFPRLLRERGDATAQQYAQMWADMNYDLHWLDGSGLGAKIDFAVLADEAALPMLFNAVSVPRAA